MARTVSIGNQDFGVIMEHQYFYILESKKF